MHPLDTKRQISRFLLSACKKSQAWLKLTVSALVEQAIKNGTNELSSDNTYAYLESKRFLMQQVEKLPDFLQVPFKSLTLLLAVWSLPFEGRFFHRLSNRKQQRYFDFFKRSKLNWQRDLISFYETLSIFSFYSCVEERESSKLVNYPSNNDSKTTSNKAVFKPKSGTMKAQIAVVGSGPGGAITAYRLADAGFDVLLIEEGPYLPLDSAAYFSKEEIEQKYRNGGVTVGMGCSKIAYPEGRCIGGGSEINRGLYHRTPTEVVETWRRNFRVEDFSENSLREHFEACESIAHISFLPGNAPPNSLKLKQGASKMGWKCIEAPRLFSYHPSNGRKSSLGRKNSMTETFLPLFFSSGGRLMSNTRVKRLRKENSHWRLSAKHLGSEIDIHADTVFLCAGPIQTPALLRRSGIKHNIGNSLRFHPMIKVVASFPEEVNPADSHDPVHQIKEFDPNFSMGCSISSLPILAMNFAQNTRMLNEIHHNWRHMAIYYAQSTDGYGFVRHLTGFRDPWVHLLCDQQAMKNLREGLMKLSLALFAAGASVIYPAIPGFSALKDEGDLHVAPKITMEMARTSISTVHLFSSCPMGANEAFCATDSFGKVFNMNGLYINDASLLCGPTVVNPQGSVMAVANRNVTAFLENRRN